MDRRDFVRLAGAILLVEAVAAIGGATAKENGQWGDDEEPP